MFTPLSYLKDLAAHNDRVWFNENRDRYEQAKREVLELTQKLILDISSFDESVRGIRPEDCLYRIYRDIRFSKDKSPYKDHMGIYISKGGKQGLHCGYYLHLTPSGSFLAGGSYGLTPKQMRELRLSILDGMDEFRRIVEDKTFKKTFPEIGREKSSRLPSYIPKDTAYPEYFKLKEYVVMTPLAENLFKRDDAASQIASLAKVMKPFLDFLNYTIDDL